MSVMTVVWIGLVAIVLGVGLVVVPATLFPVKVEPRPAGVGVITAPAVGRHAVDLTGEWRPNHRRGAPYNGRHYTGRRCWSGNLVEDTRMTTTGELAWLLAG